MRRKLVFIISIITLILIVSLIIFFGSPEVNNNNNQNDKIQIVATIFPNYDFVKQIGKDKVEVKLLLKSGVESHTYEPSPKDMIDIENCDIFVYTGNEFEPWADNIISGLNSKIEIVDTSKNINLINKEEFELQHYEQPYYGQHHYEQHHYEGHHYERHYGERQRYYESSFDSHIWLNPENTLIMIDDILANLCEIDPENEKYYTDNANHYKEQINALNSNFEQTISNSKRHNIAFAGEFSYSYFIEKYGLDFVSVYNNCGEGEDPSITKVKSVIDYINTNNLPVVFYEELSEGTVAKMIGDETEAKSMVFYTVHNGDIEKDTYVSLMNKNLENLKKALN